MKQTRKNKGNYQNNIILIASGVQKPAPDLGQDFLRSELFALNPGQDFPRSELFA
jgi:hypothetical protein